MTVINGTEWGVTLHPNHAELLTASRIERDVAFERGYRSAGDVAQLRRHGFEKATGGWLPGLLIPSWGVEGHVTGYQYRPDRPFEFDDGTTLRYLFPAGAKLHIDVHPRTRDVLLDADVPLWFTEGARKVDAGVSAGIAIVGIPGVDAWSSGGEVLPDFDAIEWEDRVVLLCFDADVRTNRDVHRALGGLWDELGRRGAKVRIVMLPDVADKAGLDDYLASRPDVPAADLCAELADLALTEMPPKPRGGRRMPDAVDTGRPRVVLDGTRPIVDIGQEVIDHMAAANDPPSVFTRSGAMVVATLDEHDRTILRQVDEGRLIRLVGAVCDPVVVGAQRTAHVAPPPDLRRVLLRWDDWPFPALAGVAGAPFLRADGTVVTAAGYDVATRVLYSPVPGFEVPLVADQPSPAELAAAVALIDDVLNDFPFETTTDRANAWGFLLTPFLKPATGLSPLILVDSAQQGSGKGLLVNLVAMVATGLSAATHQYTNDDEELRKKLTAILLAGTPIVCFDDVSAAMKSATLAALLTAPVWSDRILGGSVEAHHENAVVWCATGINVAIGGDIGRRVVHVRLNPRMANAFTRSDFRHDDLLGYTRSHRGELVAACLTVCRAWFAAGQPPPAAVPRLGSYERWAEVVAGVLAHAGVNGFLEGMAEDVSEMDEESADWLSFLSAWHGLFGSHERSVKDLVEELQRNPAFRLSLPGDLLRMWDREEFRHSLGSAIRKRRDRMFGDEGYHLQIGGQTREKTRKWAVRMRYDADDPLATPIERSQPPEELKKWEW